MIPNDSRYEGIIIGGWSKFCLKTKSNKAFQNSYFLTYKNHIKNKSVGGKYNVWMGRLSNYKPLGGACSLGLYPLG